MRKRNLPTRGGVSIAHGHCKAKGRIRGREDVDKRQRRAATAAEIRLPPHRSGAHHPLDQRDLHHRAGDERPADLQRPPGALCRPEIQLRQSGAEPDRPAGAGWHDHRADADPGRHVQHHRRARPVDGGRQAGSTRLPRLGDDPELPGSRHRTALALLLRLGIRDQRRHLSHRQPDQSASSGAISFRVGRSCAASAARSATTSCCASITAATTTCCRNSPT